MFDDLGDSEYGVSIVHVILVVFQSVLRDPLLPSYLSLFTFYLPLRHENFNGLPGKYLPQPFGRRNFTG